MPIFINAAQSGTACLINAEGVAAISAHAKSDYMPAHISVVYANGALDRLINYPKGEQSFDLEDIADKLATAHVDMLRDNEGALFSPHSAVYIKYCPNDGPAGSPQLAIGVLGVEREMRINGTMRELRAVIAKITSNRPFTAFDMEQTSYTNAANPSKVYVDTSAIRMIRDQSYTVDIRFDTFRPQLDLNVKIKAGILDVPVTASAAFKAALEEQKKAERASLKPLAIALGRSCPHLLEVHASLDTGKSLLFVAPENIARIEPFSGYWYLNVRLKPKAAGSEGELVQVDCGSQKAMEDALASLARPARPAGAPVVKPGRK